LASKRPQQVVCPRPVGVAAYQVTVKCPKTHVGCSGGWGGG
jgi:hypothetical protein